jgi:hypothetical protein
MPEAAGIRNDTGFEMLATRFELLLTASSREQLDAVAADLGVSAADAVRLALRRMAAAHSRKVRRAAPAMPAALPAAPPAITAMSLDELHVLRDELALQTSPEASREYDMVNQQIIIREMRGVPR